MRTLPRFLSILFIFLSSCRVYVAELPRILVNKTALDEINTSGSINGAITKHKDLELNDLPSLHPDLSPSDLNFRESLNLSFISGRYEILRGDNSDPTGVFVEFFPDGRITGAKLFEAYSLCLESFCPELSKGDLIALYNREEKKWQSFGIKKKGKEITLYLLKMNPDGFEFLSPYIFLKPTEKS